MARRQPHAPPVDLAARVAVIADLGGGGAALDQGRLRLCWTIAPLPRAQGEALALVRRGRGGGQGGGYAIGAHGRIGPTEHLLRHALEQAVPFLLPVIVHDEVLARGLRKPSDQASVPLQRRAFAEEYALDALAHRIHPSQGLRARLRLPLSVDRHSNPIDIIYPNTYNYIQIYSSQIFEEEYQITLQNSTLGSFSELRSIPISNNPIITVPDIFYFQDKSQGPVGNKYWNFNNQSILDPSDPYYYCVTPGVYEVQLLISGLNQQEDLSSITVIALGSDSVLNDIGDINGDGSVSLLDVLICSNSILGFSELGPEEFISSDLDHNGIIDLYDILSIIKLIN